MNYFSVFFDVWILVFRWSNWTVRVESWWYRDRNLRSQVFHTNRLTGNASFVLFCETNGNCTIRVLVVRPRVVASKVVRYVACVTSLIQGRIMNPSTVLIPNLRYQNENQLSRELFHHRLIETRVHERIIKLPSRNDDWHSFTTCNQH